MLYFLFQNPNKISATATLLIKKAAGTCGEGEFLVSAKAKTSSIIKVYIGDPNGEPGLYKIKFRRFRKDSLWTESLSTSPEWYHRLYNLNPDTTYEIKVKRQNGMTHPAIKCTTQR